MDQLAESTRKGRGLLLCVFFITSLAATAQNASLWNDVDPATVLTKGQRQIVPQQHRTVSLDITGMRNALATAPTGDPFSARGSSSVISLPMPDGSMVDFQYLQASIMHPDLQAMFPDIRSYAGVGVEDPGLSIRFDVTLKGFHAMVLGGEHGPVFIDPYSSGTTSEYIVYYKKDFQKQLPPDFQACSYESVNNMQKAWDVSKDMIRGQAGARVGDCQFRTYTLALACTGEYANYHGSNTTNNNKGPAMSAMNTTMVRVNGIYERDATLTMVLVAGNDQLIYLNGATDPYSNTNGGAMLGQNQTTCDGVIGSANYDIGHVFSTGGGGEANHNSPCNNSLKAGGVTGQSAPIGDPFDIDYVAHEMGHQYGGNHTQNNNCNRAGSAAVEVGSGITIMGYAGICAPNVASNSIAMFGGYSMQEIHANITGGTSSSCPTVTALLNDPPTANAGANYTIPRSTPFVLEGIGTDPDVGDVLSYSWEQMDATPATMPPQSSNTAGPAFEPLLPVSSPDRYMPNLDDLTNNISPTWEVLSSVSRSYNFRLTVRDNAAGGGCNDQDNMVVTVDGGSGPFVVTAPNTAVSWNALSPSTVTWNVAGTNGSPVNATNVDIFLSVDGGFTYPYTLATATPNDGSQSITVPNAPTAEARVMVRGSGNIFFDISNVDFTIVSSVPDYAMDTTTPVVSTCQPNNAQFTITTASISGYTDPITLSTSGMPAGLNANFSPNPVTPGNNSTLTVSNTGAASPGSYDFSVNGNSTSGPKFITVTLEIQNAPAQGSLNSPSNGATGVAAGTPLVWNADPQADTYTIQIATDVTMTNIVESGSFITGTSFSPSVATAPLTTYYWRVHGVNPCAVGLWSQVRSFTTSDCISVDVQIILDQYGSETTWSISDGTTTYASGGPYSDFAGAGEYPQTPVNVCLPAGCYDLTVTDSFGDGNCCAYGNGEIYVEDGAAHILASVSGDINIGAPAVVNFCVPFSCANVFPYSLDFESGIDNWIQSSTDDFDWTLDAGGTPSANTGPSGDHTTGSGTYLYTEASNPNFPSKTAVITSKCFDLSGASSANLSFWYHMYGAFMGSLNVDILTGATVTPSVLTISGDQGNSWQQASVNLTPFIGSEVSIRFRGTTGSDGTNGFQSDMAIDDINITVSAGVKVGVKAFLEGPYVVASGQMSDALRTLPSFPLTEPYTSLGYAHVGGGGGETIAPSILTVTGNNAIVDWVVLELRSAGDNTNIVATRSALIQRDGNIVDTDGTSDVLFNVPAANYYIAVRHRNHLGIMTAGSFALNSLGTNIDQTSTQASSFGTTPKKNVSGVFCMWMGNVVRDVNLKYTGSGNDRDPILAAIPGSVPTNTISGYRAEDCNMDGTVKYTGSANDRDPILTNIGGSVPTSIRTEQLP